MARSQAALVPIALLLAAWLAGCSQEAPSAATVQAATATGAPAPAAAPAAAGDAMFSMQPASFRICDAANGAIAATARWNVSDRGIEAIAIYVIDAHGGRKLWLEGGARGESTTGAWVFPGTRFELVEKASGQALAAVAVEGVRCP